MNAKTAYSPPIPVKPQLIIDADLYPRLLAVAEGARKQVPELADQLIEEIERAKLCAAGEMPANVVTIGSTVTFRDGDRTATVRVVMPHEADVDQGRVSVVTPVGAALLGLAAGQKIIWEMPDGREKLLEVLDVRQ